MNRVGLVLAVGVFATAVHAATWGRIERPDFSVSEATVAVDNEARGRSGHMGHALIDCGGGRILAFNSNTPTNRCAGHSGFGWMEYRVSPDYGRTWGVPRVLDYSMRLFKEGQHTALCEKGVRAPDGRIILFFQITDASRPISCEPWSEPTFIESRDGGETWSDARQACPEKGRIYDAVVDRDSVYFLMPTSPRFCATNQDYVVYKSTNGGPFVRHVTSIEASEKGYGAMEFAKDGSLVVYAYDSKDEEHPQYCISRDRGETWGKPARATCAKFIRNPQLRRVDDDWFLCGRNGGRSWNDPGRGDGLVLYHSTDGIHWDEGIKVDQRPDGTGTGHYSCLLPIREPGRPPRLLLQYSQPYWSQSVNVMQRWIEPATRNVVFCPAHPDDIAEPAGLVLLMKGKFRVHEFGFTRGARFLPDRPGVLNQELADLRTAEEEKVAAFAGMELHWIDEVNGDAYASSNSVARMTALLKELNPRAVFLHWPCDIHNDHVMSAAAMMKAIEFSGLKPEIYFFPQNHQSRGFEPDVFVDIRSVWEKKVELIRLYKRENTNDYLVWGKDTASRAWGWKFRPQDDARAEAYRSFRPRVQGERTIFDEL